MDVSRFGTFAVSWTNGTATELIGSLPADPGERFVRICDVTDRAVVLGSSQPLEVVSASLTAAAGVSVVRRRAGGGAVYVGPGEQLWADLFVPAGDPLHETDVGVAFYWLGDVFAEVIGHVSARLTHEPDEIGRIVEKDPALADQRERLGERFRTSVHKGALITTPWSRLMCFCGLGAGEVLLGNDKVLGLAQRRTRAGAWLHAMVPCVFKPRDLVDLLDLDDERRERAVRALVASYTAVGPLDELVSVLLKRLATIPG